MNQKTTSMFFKKTAFLVLFLFGITTQIQAQRTVEKLNRGLVAMRLNTNQVYVGWRMLGTEPTDVSYNLYFNNVKLAESPFTSTTNFTHNSTTNGTYSVRAVINGIEEPASETASVWANQYLDIAMQIPAGGTTPDNVVYTYSVNDCSVGDVDGDGQYEIFVKWDPSNAKDNSQSGYTGNVFIDCYRLNGTRLWRINLGKNIRAGAHYTQFMVYDLDSDGKAEIACKTADGTIDGTGVVIGSATADYRNSTGYVLSGPEFLTIFNGETGKAMASTNYLPARGSVSSWGDNYGNRVDRFIAAVAYLDGSKPS
jgi:rhamnogalacturonan endolyase